MAFLCFKYKVKAASVNLQGPAWPCVSTSGHTCLQPPALATSHSCLFHQRGWVHFGLRTLPWPVRLLEYSSHHIYPWVVPFCHSSPGQMSSLKTSQTQVPTQSFSVKWGSFLLSEQRRISSWDYPVCLFSCLFTLLPWNTHQEGSTFFVSVLTIPVLCASAVKYLRIFVKQMNKG